MDERLDAPLELPDGTTTTLRAHLGKPLLLVLLRHLN